MAIEYKNLRSLAEVINLHPEDNPCTKGNGNCCTIYAPVSPDDWEHILEGKKLGEITPEVFESAITNAQNPMRVSCPFLNRDRQCSIYDRRPLDCMVWGIAGTPDLNSKEVETASKKMSTTQVDQRLSLNCVRPFTCESCKLSFKEDATFSLARSLTSKMADDHVMSFYEKGLTTIQGFVLSNIELLKS